MAQKFIFLRHKSGATHEFKGRRATKLCKELAAGRGTPELTALIVNDYAAFLGPDGEDWDLDALKPEHFGTYY